MTKKTYIAGPMKGYPELNYPAFHAEAANLRAQEIRVVNPAEIVLPEGTHPLEYLRVDLLAMLNECDTIHLLPGWEKSYGAGAESFLAQKLEFKITYADDTVVRVSEKKYSI